MTIPLKELKHHFSSKYDFAWFSQDRCQDLLSLWLLTHRFHVSLGFCTYAKKEKLAWIYINKLEQLVFRSSENLNWVSKINPIKFSVLSWNDALLPISFKNIHWLLCLSKIILETCKRHFSSCLIIFYSSSRPYRIV